MASRFLEKNSRLISFVELLKLTSSVRGHIEPTDTHNEHECEHENYCDAFSRNKTTSGTFRRAS